MEQTILLFGPQFLTFTADSLVQLRSHCLEFSGAYDWLSQIIHDLPQHWITISTAFPQFNNLHALQQIEELANFMHTGNPKKVKFPLPNFLLCPLVVITHLTQYLRYRKSVGLEHEDAWSIGKYVEYVGFCTGLLSAIIVSASKSRQELETIGATATRLAMLIGAVVDADDQFSDSRSVCLSVAWQAHATVNDLNCMLETFPEVWPIPYISAHKRF